MKPDWEKALGFLNTTYEVNTQTKKSYTQSQDSPLEVYKDSHKTNHWKQPQLERS